MERSKKFLTGLGNQYYRATYKSMGFTSDDLTRPIIGIANSWSESDPGHFNLQPGGPACPGRRVPCWRHPGRIRRDRRLRWHGQWPRRYALYRAPSGTDCQLY